MKGIRLRNLEDADYPYVISVINDWWGGRPMADLLPRLFFQCFHDTCFAAVREGDELGLAGFSVGFVSQTDPREAYIHFVGVRPDLRNHGLARDLYARFFETVRSRGCQRVRCVTSPANQESIAFHKRMGFQVEPGDVAEAATLATSNYDGQGHARVRFVKEFTAP